MTWLNYDYPEDEHALWRAAAERKGQTIKEWVRRSLNQAAEAERSEDDRRR